MSKTKIERTFNNVRTFSSDVWIADYTEQSRIRGLRMTAKEKSALKTGVHIQDAAFGDINAFHLHNGDNVPFMAVNFEENKSFFPDGNKDCECMFRAKGVKHGWLLLCELKYCLDKAKNVLDNGDTAIKQLESTWKLLAELKPSLFDVKHCHSFLNVSFPNGNTSVPFGSFQLTQDFVLDLRKKSKVTLLGANDVIVVSNGMLKVEQPTI